MEGCRLATRDDLPRIVELARAVREEIRSVRGGDVWAVREGRAEPLEESYGALFDDAGVRVLVGTIDGTVMGFAVGETDVLHDGRLLGIISDICVEPGARAIGVGEEMANDLVAYFRSIGCMGVDSWALPGQRETKNFFEEHGFVSRGIVVHKRLVGDPSDGDEAGVFR